MGLTGSPIFSPVGGEGASASSSRFVLGNIEKRAVRSSAMLWTGRKRKVAILKGVQQIAII